ncbi:acetoin utilization protein AcuC [Acidimangrovimonas pyrenivorans]|uniref:Acetoin utilization protein AcuC n=1 Tax=Acidimangrovimonas pyrenivorans TaxID=2030798 RepID=A0ABV7AK70_9RHOB
MPVSFISSEIYRATGYSRNHPLAIQRIGSVLTLSEQLGWLPGGYVDSYRATLDDLLKFHSPDYVAAIREAEQNRRVTEEMREKYKIGTLENPVFQGLYERASMSVGGSIQAARLAARGGIAYHPSGGTHHGMRDHASGFCFFNDPVFAILTLLEEGMERVLYVDLDAHHGDGVEFAFKGEDRVMTISVHEENRWPWTGTLDDRSTGNARNLPVPREMNDSEMDFLMASAVLPLARRFAPQAVVVTCGADPLDGDPLSSLALSNSCLWDAVMALTELAPATVVLGGGGYNPWTVARCWTGLWGRIAGYDMPGELPPESRALLEALDCDLVDDEDEMRPEWTATLADPRNDGMIRERFHEIAEAVLAPGGNELVA